MTTRNNNNQSLRSYLSGLPVLGRYWFTVSELLEALPFKELSLRVALSRLAKEGQVLMIRRGFGIILSVHGKDIHPTYFIDPMMKHLNADYYVGLLSAASYWGASHQSSMVYQIITDKVITPLELHNCRIEFIVKKKPLLNKYLKKVAGIGGYVLMSSPELTAMDLLRHPTKGAHLSNIATVISELAPQWRPHVIKTLCREDGLSTIILQRLGYILEEVLHLKKQAGYVESALRDRLVRKQFLSQTSHIDRANALLNTKWSLYINTILEPE